ncbi:MAG TPA: rod shape-determining protein RodA [Clostridiales bacterium]|nr:rod shape-determining protein RodA [Clostridiales bacterium]
MQLVAKVRSIDHLRKFDYILFFTVIAITAFGLVSLKSATYSMKYGAGIYKTQIYMAVAGTVIALFLNFIDYRIYKTFALYLYGASVLMLLAVFFVGSGSDEVGAGSWLSIPGLFKFQPSEIAKIMYVLLIALIFEKLSTVENKAKYFIMLMIFAVIPVGLIFKEPDAGTALAFVVSFIIMLFVYGIKARFILIGGGIIGASIPIAWRFILKPYQKNRILSIFQPELQTADDLYQINKAKTAISSGQWFGQGLFKGIQTQNNGIPIKESDFIFSVIGEEMGFVGVGVLLVLFTVLIIRIFYIAATAEDLYGTFVASGIGGIYLYHFLQNVGMNIGLLPITGIPLPFVSAGGSAMITNFIAMGIVLSISLRRSDGMFEKPGI